jgi:5-methylcytosine-specific restriction endonuclease McrA
MRPTTNVKCLQCNKCGYNEHKQLLEVHHIDNDSSNNDPSNLEILCVMCHRKYHYGLK